MKNTIFFNKKSPQSHAISELGKVGVARKLMKYAIHSCKKTKIQKYIFLPIGFFKRNS
jgi:hypothetical protein